MRKEKSQRSFSAASRCGGLTLVEILVTLVIISIGLLGVAGMQMRTLRDNYDALMRSHASALASDIADRMRANVTAVRAASGDSAYQTTFENKPTAGTNPSQAVLDIVTWKQAITDRLPGGAGAIDVTENTGRVTISVRWGERTNVAADATVTFVTETVI